MQLQNNPEPGKGSIADLLNDKQATRRAAKALRCLPFRRAFYEEVGQQALSSGELCRRHDALRLCTKTMTPERVEAHWIWLIKLGVLRREVDGQGLTHRVRLTPMGRRTLLGWKGETSKAGITGYIHHAFTRHWTR
jgi:hypothetical protein